jgi:hypothetical protein
MAAVTRRAAPAKTARMSSGRNTRAHQDGNNRTSGQYGYAINDHPDCEDGSEGGLKGKDDRAGHNRRHGVFDDQQCPPRLQCESEQHTGSDQLHITRDGVAAFDASRFMVSSQ